MQGEDGGRPPKRQKKTTSNANAGSQVEVQIKMFEAWKSHLSMEVPQHFAKIITTFVKGTHPLHTGPLFEFQKK
jgi:hypothetical protein